MSVDRPLAGRLILLLEDEPLIAMDVCETLEDAGARVLGPMCGVRQALAAIEGTPATGDGRIDGAVLDVNLGDRHLDRDCDDGGAVAARLTALRVPFVFHTGELIRRDGPIARLGAPIVAKPSRGLDLVAALLRAIPCPLARERG